MSNFSDVIYDEIESLVKKREAALARATNSTFHVDSIRSIISATIPQIEAFTGSSDELKREFISVLNQVPSATHGIWQECANEIKAIEAEIQRWTEMASMYDEWRNSQTVSDSGPEEIEGEVASESSNDEIISKIESGEIKEPSTQTAMRRKIGERPPITLGQYRKITSNSDSGEESEA